MGLADVDPLAVLPVTAATASAAFARAADPGRERGERQQQLAVLATSLDAVGRLLDRCQQEAARLAGELAEQSWASDECPVREAVCRRCPGVPLSCSGGLWHCPRCGRVTDLARAELRCPEPPAVIVRDQSGAQQTTCLSHAAAAVRQVRSLVVVSAARADRVTLSEIASESNIVRRPAPGRTDARAAGSL